MTSANFPLWQARAHSAVSVVPNRPGHARNATEDFVFEDFCAVAKQQSSARRVVSRPVHEEVRWRDYHKSRSSCCSNLFPAVVNKTGERLETCTSGRDVKLSLTSTRSSPFTGESV
ncbi:hypothetical protein BaRGS_00026017 [Batillaria attramentaria]|uniref:Uncharacterized protein n=1 Tax=Batillaria attramentaria TaxID=370345 RepID=A0ABD0K656_9CAEN